MILKAETPYNFLTLVETTKKLKVSTRPCKMSESKDSTIKAIETNLTTFVANLPNDTDKFDALMKFAQNNIEDYKLKTEFMDALEFCQSSNADMEETLIKLKIALENNLNENLEESAKKDMSELGINDTYGCDGLSDNCLGLIPYSEVNWFTSSLGFCTHCINNLLRFPQKVLDFCYDECEGGDDDIADFVCKLTKS